MAAKSTDADCQAAASSVGHPLSASSYDRYGFLVRHSKVNGSTQRFVRLRLRRRILYLAHSPLLAGHPGSRRMYQTMRHDFYWRNMANDVYHTVSYCSSCAKTSETYYRHPKKLLLFHPNGPLEYVALDLLVPLPISPAGNNFVFFMTNRYTKLTRAIPLSKTTAAHVATAFLGNWIYPYGITGTVLSDNGSQFISAFLKTVCRVLGTRHVFTTSYHPPTNGNTELYNKTLVDRLRHYISEHQDDWDQYIQPRTYSYNTQVHRSTGFTPFNLTLRPHPRAQSSLPLPRPLRTTRTHRLPLGQCAYACSTDSGPPSWQPTTVLALRRRHTRSTLTSPHTDLPQVHSG